MRSAPESPIRDESQDRSGPSDVSNAAWQVVAEVLQRMQSDLDRAWTLEDAARTSGYEVHHFAHTFRAVVGMPPLAYLRQLRLERAAHQLVIDPQVPVGDIAKAAGYGSLEAFTRAFRRAFRMSPRYFRREGSTRAGGGVDAPQPHALVDLAWPAGLDAEPRIEQIGPLYGWTVIAESFDDPIAIASAFMPLLVACPPDGAWQLGGVSQPWGWLSGSGMQELRALRLMDAGAPAPKPPIVPWRLPRGWFARFDYTGEQDGIAAACAWIMAEWVPRSGLRVGFAPMFSLLEGVLNMEPVRARLHAPIEAIG